MTTSMLNAGGHWMRAGGFLLLSALSGLAARAEQPGAALEEYSVKAALLFNIAKYTDWPEDSFGGADAPIVLGVLGDDPFGEVLDRVVAGRLIKGRSIEIRRASGIAPLQGAHLVFVSASQPQAPEECAALERASVLTISDTEFAEPYTAVNFAVRGDKVAFSVDLTRVLRTGATISSRLLKFAQRVKRADDVVVQ